MDEGHDEQGIAHLVEHVTFLGSRKREGLLGTGARSNAYTDFHHTVFHVHSPLTNTSSVDPSPMLPQVRARSPDLPSLGSFSAHDPCLVGMRMPCLNCNQTHSVESVTVPEE